MRGRGDSSCRPDVLAMSSIEEMKPGGDQNTFEQENGDKWIKRNIDTGSAGTVVPENFVGYGEREMSMDIVIYKTATGELVKSGEVHASEPSPEKPRIEHVPLKPPRFLPHDRSSNMAAKHPKQ